jgi:hypothetical protein
MLKRLAIAAGAAITAVAVGAVLFGTVLAAGPGPKNGNGADIGGRDIPLAVASELTGMTEDELLAELEGGKTIPALLEELGEELGFDLTDFHQAVADARQAAVDEAVAEGTITPEQAQWMRQHMTQTQASEGPYGPQYGEGRQLGDCTGGDANRYGMSDQGKGWGEPSEDTGPGLEHRYGGSTR